MKAKHRGHSKIDWRLEEVEKRLKGREMFEKPV